MCEKIGSSDALMDALDKFDVSFNFFGPLEKMIFQKTDKDNDHKISRAEFIQHMKLTRCIAAGQWDVLFDELDADKNGALSHSEFWTKKALKNSANIADALDQFDVSMTYNRGTFGRFSKVQSVKLTSFNSES